MNTSLTACLLPAMALCFTSVAHAAPSATSTLAGSVDPPQAPAGLIAAGTLRSEPLHAAKGPGGLTLPDGPPTAVTPAPLPAAYCQINVNGALKDTETDYLPRVIQCENGGANLQALKAQAIAARSVAYYAMAENGKICDGQGCQVYSCGSQPSALAVQAVQETAGQYLSFNNEIKGRVLTYAFFVSGDNDQTANCHGVDPGANTENYVTYNEGKTWTGVKETSLGFQYKDPNQYGYGQNRGCMSQWSARCLENKKGYNHDQIIRYFYGADIEIAQAQGPCVGKTDFAAKYAGQSFPLASMPPVVMKVGDTLDAWIDLTNVGDQTWTGNTRLAPTPRDVASPLAHASWITPTRITGPDADTPPDAVGRFSFQIAANEPGDYYQTFGLVEEGVTWFSDAPKGGGPPDDQLEIHIVIEPAPPEPATTSAGETSGDPTTSGGPGGGDDGTEESGTGAPHGDDSGEAPTEGGGSSGSSGGASTGGLSAGPGSSFSGDGSAGSEDDGDDGCGCRSTPTSGPIWLLTPLLLLLRRRR